MMNADVVKYEHLSELEKKHSVKRKKIYRNSNIYHVIDIILHVVIIFCCYKFDVGFMYNYEKDIFYSFKYSLLDIFIVSLLKYIYTVIQKFMYSAIDSEGKLKKCNVVSKHVSGIICLATILKFMNFCYNIKSVKEHYKRYKSISLSNVSEVQDSPEWNVSYDTFIYFIRICLMIYTSVSSAYFYFMQFVIYPATKKHIITETELKKHFQTYILDNNNNNINIGYNGDSKKGTWIGTEHISFRGSEGSFAEYMKEQRKKKTEFELNNFDKKHKWKQEDVVIETENKKNSSNQKSNTFAETEVETDKETVNNNRKKKSGKCFNKKKEKEKELHKNVSFEIPEFQDQVTFKEFLTILAPYFWPSKRLDLQGNSLMLRFFVILIIIAIIASRFFSIISPIFLGSASNEILKRNFDKVVYYLILYVGFAFISKILKEIYSTLYSQVQQSAFIEIQESVFEKIHNLSFEWYSTKNAGSIIRAVDRGVESANSLMNSLLVYIIPAAIEGIVTCAVFVLKFENSTLGSILYIGLVAYVYSTIKITKWRKKIRSKANKMDNVYHDIAHDSLANYETVKYFNNENFEIKRFCDALSNYNIYNLKILNSLGILNAVQQLILCATLFSILYCAVNMIMYGEADNGILITFVVYIANVFAPLNILGTLYTNIVRSFADISDLSNVLREKSVVVDDSKFTSFMLTPHEKKFGVSVELDNVSFNYPSQPFKNSLKNINIFIPAGTTCAIVGHTGAGKTTVAKLLYRFYDGQGKIKIGGRDINQYNKNSIRRIIGIVPQDTVLFNETIRYNILYGKLDASEKELIKAVKSAQLYDFIEGLPKKWDTLVGDRGIKLSGGERQRISIARCLLKNPKIVIFDEATSLLDSKTEYLFQKAVEDLRHNRTLIIIAHRLSTILTAEQVVLLNKGEVKEKGTHQSLLELNGEYAQLWNIQSKSNKEGIFLDNEHIKENTEGDVEGESDENDENDEQNNTNERNRDGRYGKRKEDNKQQKQQENQEHESGDDQGANKKE